MSILKNKFFYISIGILIIYILPWLLFGKNSYILIHDNLDSNVVWFKILAHSGKIFSNSLVTINNFMDIPRASLGNEMNIILWLYDFFEPYTAYVINEIFIRIVAYIGMFLLLSGYVLKEKYITYTLLFSSLYAILPFWPSGGLSVAGLPLITYIFLNIRGNKERLVHWIVLILFPLYSDFVLSMMFYIIFVGFVWLRDIFTKEVTWKFTIALFIFGAIYLLINYRLLEVFVSHTSFISHRIEFIKEYYGLFEAFKRTILFFILGQYHAHSLHTFFGLFVGIVFLVNIFSKKRDKLLIGLFILNIVIAIIFGFDKYEGVKLIREYIPLLNELQLRFYFVSPLIWFVLFALSIKYFLENIKYIRYKEHIVYLFIILSFIYSFYRSDFIHEYKNSNITYREFFATKLFNNIKRYIQKDPKDYKIVSIGIHPSIAQYNGFYTLDGYSANYPLEYKHKFRKIIANELEKNDNLKRGFDNWGSRCYIFVNDIGYNYIRKKDKVYPINIDINSTQLLKMNALYIFSSYPIANFKSNNLLFLKKFSDQNSAWDIFLYQIKKNEGEMQ